METPIRNQWGFLKEISGGSKDLRAGFLKEADDNQCGLHLLSTELMGLQREVHGDCSRNLTGIPRGTQREFCKEINGDSLRESINIP